MKWAILLAIALHANVASADAAQERAQAREIQIAVANSLYNRGTQLVSMGYLRLAKELFVESIEAYPEGAQVKNCLIAIRNVNIKLGLKPQDGVPAVGAKPGPTAVPLKPTEPKTPLTPAPPPEETTPPTKPSPPTNPTPPETRPPAGPPKTLITPYSMGTTPSKPAPATPPTISDPYGGQTSPPEKPTTSVEDPYGEGTPNNDWAGKLDGKLIKPGDNGPGDNGPGDNGPGESGAKSKDGPDSEITNGSGNDTEVAASPSDDNEEDRKWKWGGAQLMGVMHGASLGAGIGFAVAGDDSDSQLIGVSIGGLVGAGGGFFAARQGWLSDQTATTLFSTSSIGGAIGAFTADLSTGRDNTDAGDVALGAAIGMAVGTGAGIALHLWKKPTIEQMSLVDTTAAVGGVAGIMLAAGIDPPHEEAYSLNASIGLAVGTAGGILLMDKWQPSLKRLRWVNIGAGIGATVPWLAAVALEDGQRHKMGYVSALGVVAGGLTAVLFTRGMDDDDKDSENVTGSLLNKSAEHWSVGVPSLTLLPGTTPDKPPAVGLSLAAGTW